MTIEKWEAPTSNGWAFLAVEERPVTPDDIARLATDDGCVAEEVAVIKLIASIADFEVSPWISICASTDPGEYDVEVIVPPNETEMN